MQSNDKISRRKFLKTSTLGLGLSGSVGLGYSLHRGIRYPTLSLEPKAMPRSFPIENSSTLAYSTDFIQVPDVKQEPRPRLRLRAFSAEPRLTLTASDVDELTLVLSNIARDATLVSSNAKAQIEETVSGIHRRVTFKVNAGEQISLRWKLPFENDFTFASIGDSGGDKELAWCLTRAEQLGARFFLHLGDFNYQAGDYDRAIKLFEQSSIPCYISIGNHDFHESGLIYQHFLDYLGPLNHAFTIGKTRFVNLDTAANTLPYSAGHRGALINELEKENATVIDTVSFTHRPLHDPLGDSSHDIGSTGERDWLINALKRINSNTLLSGHIHIYDRRTFDGIDNIIAGQGLGHQDLIVQKDYSKMVLGRVDGYGKLSYTTEPLKMPMELHCHPRTQPVKDSLLQGENSADYRALLERVEKSCN